MVIYVGTTWTGWHQPPQSLNRPERKQRYKQGKILLLHQLKIKTFFSKLVTSLVLAVFSTCHAYADTVTFTLENLVQDNGQQMTGSFDWIYTTGDFENGIAVFTDLYIPGFGSDISALNISVGTTELDFSLRANIHSGGVNINLFLLTPFSPTQPALIDQSISAYEIEVGKQNGGFVSGNVVASAVPVPSALLLFGSGFFAVAALARRKT